jgi:ribosomal protein S18 acetylase RimI-like enzyme
MFRKIKVSDIKQVAKLHREELSGFLSELGRDFLEKFYKVSLIIPEIFTIVIEEKKQILGFTSGAVRLRGLYKKIFMKDPLGFIFSLLSYSITHPGKIVKLTKTMVYPGFESDIPELLTIVIDKNQRNRGLGRKLFLAAVKEFKKRGIDDFRVSVYKRLPANEFYKKIGLKLEKQFDFMGEKMNYYRYKEG